MILEFPQVSGLRELLRLIRNFIQAGGYYCRILLSNTQRFLKYWVLEGRNGICYPFRAFFEQKLGIRECFLEVIPSGKRRERFLQKVHIAAMCTFCVACAHPSVCAYNKENHVGTTVWQKNEFFLFI